MCGIIGIISSKDVVVQRVLHGLELLEYRGYDSAGIVTLSAECSFITKKCVGRVKELVALCNGLDQLGKAAMGHTRWATHGAPKIENTHPIIIGNVAVVHNGIIDNYQDLRTFLIRNGYHFSGDTDTETITILIHYYYNIQQLSPIEAVYRAEKDLKGVFAFVVMFENLPNLMIGVQRGLPLVLGIAKNELYIASDSLAFTEYTDQSVLLEENEVAVIENNDYYIFNLKRERLTKQITLLSRAEHATKKNYETFMQKEIYEQPEIISRLFEQYLEDYLHNKTNNISKVDWDKYDNICIVACGSSFYAGCISKYWIEKLTDKYVNVEIASEFYSRQPKINSRTVYIFISQSGETADTLLSAKYVKEQKGFSLAIVNILESRIAKLVDNIILIKANREIGVAATKSFTAQLSILLLIALYVQLFTGHKQLENNDQLVIRTLLQPIKHDIRYLHVVLDLAGHIQQIAKNYIQHARCVLFIGRGALYPLALEGALKMKELTYIPSEGFAAGELKHGSIALIDEKTVIIAIAPSNHTFEKMVSNIQEVKARNGKIIVICDSQGATHLTALANAIIQIPYGHALLEPILYSIPIQMLAYYTADTMKLDIDKPRNLAKSVTVE